MRFTRPSCSRTCLTACFEARPADLLRHTIRTSASMAGSGSPIQLSQRQLGSEWPSIRTPSNEKTTAEQLQHLAPSEPRTLKLEASFFGNLNTGALNLGCLAGHRQIVERSVSATPSSMGMVCPSNLFSKFGLRS